jgi:hypothetical protein
MAWFQFKEYVADRCVIHRHYFKRKRYTPVPKADTAVEYTGGYESPMAAEREAMVKKSPGVSTTEVQH